MQKRGFTIVELLIVIVVIAILAAITIVAYNGIQTRANDSVIQQDLSKVAKQLEIAKVDLGHYPQAVGEIQPLALSKASYYTANNNVYYCLNIANDEYALGFISKSNNSYLYKAGTTTKYSSVITGTTTCNAVGLAWGAVGSFSHAAYYSGAWQTWTNG